MLSYNATRWNPGVLNRQSINRKAYIYYPDSPSVRKVVFSIDGKVFHSETTGPWDLAGTAVNGANPWNPSTLSAGAHTVLATVTTTSGTTLKTQATFFVPAAAAKALVVKSTSALAKVATTASGSKAATLNGATVKGHRYLVFSTPKGVVRAQFLLDGKLVRVAATSAGGRVSMTPLKTASLHKGKHRLVIRMVAKSGQQSVATAAFTIA
jgi:hypothetical protein